MADNSEIVSKETKHFLDSSSITITIYQEKNAISPHGTTSTISGAKNYTMRNENGGILWVFTLKGTFEVNSGVSAKCTGTSYTTSKLASSWQLDSASTYASGNKTIGDATFKHKTLFITTDTKSCHVVLTCDANGNLS